MTNNEIMANIDKAVILLDDMIGKTDNDLKKYQLTKAREYMQYAWAYFNHNRNDDAGRYLEAANKIIKEVRA